MKVIANESEKDDEDEKEKDELDPLRPSPVTYRMQKWIGRGRNILSSSSVS